RVRAVPVTDPAGLKTAKTQLAVHVRHLGEQRLSARRQPGRAHLFGCKLRGGTGKTGEHRPWAVRWTGEERIHQLRVHFHVCGRLFTAGLQRGRRGRSHRLLPLHPHLLPGDLHHTLGPPQRGKPCSDSPPQQSCRRDRAHHHDGHDRRGHNPPPARPPAAARGRAHHAPHSTKTPPANSVTPHTRSIVTQRSRIAYTPKNS